MKANDRIIHKLEKIAPVADQKYRHEELLPKYREIEQAMLKEVFQDRYSQNLTARDLMAHLQHMAEEYSLTDTKAYTSVMASLQSFSFELAGLINGEKGERYAQRALNWLDVENYRLDNLELQFDGESSEYDNIVITPGGIFIIEVKFSKTDMVIDQNGNYGPKGRCNGYSHNIGSQIQSKEYVLWKTLEADFSGMLSRGHIHSILLFANNYSRVEDNFNHIEVRTCGDVNYSIKAQSNTEAPFTTEQMRSIQDFLRSVEVKSAYKPTFDIRSLMTNFADMVTQIEQEAHREMEPDSEAKQVPTVHEASSDNEWCLDWISSIIGSAVTAFGYLTYRYARKYGIPRL